MQSFLDLYQILRHFLPLRLSHLLYLWHLLLQCLSIWILRVYSRGELPNLFKFLSHFVFECFLILASIELGNQRVDVRVYLHRHCLTWSISLVIVSTDVGFILCIIKWALEYTNTSTKPCTNVLFRCSGPCMMLLYDPDGEEQTEVARHKSPSPVQAR